MSLIDKLIQLLTMANAMGIPEHLIIDFNFEKQVYVEQNKLYAWRDLMRKCVDEAYMPTARDRGNMLRVANALYRYYMGLNR